MTTNQSPALDGRPEGIAPRRESKGCRRASAAALVAGGLIAGGVLASSISATAETTDPETSTTVPDERAKHKGETLLEGDIAASVEEAVLVAYPDATILRLETDSDGVYEAHIRTDDGPVTVKLDENFAITGEEAGGGRGPHARGGPGMPGGVVLDEATAGQVEDAILAAHPDATVLRAGELPDGGYVALIQTAEDERLLVRLDADFQVTDEISRDNAGRPAELDADTAAKVEDAVLAEYPGATVERTMARPDGSGYAAHVVTADGEDVLLGLDEDFTVTGAITREGPGDRLGRMGERLGHMGERLGRMGDRLERWGDRLGDSSETADDATAQSSSYTV